LAKGSRRSWSPFRPPRSPRSRPPPAKDAKDAKDAKADAEEPAKSNPFLMEPENGPAPVAGSTSPFARNKGVIFLVDAKSRQVLWSTYEPPKSTVGKELDRTAIAIVDRLKKDLKRK